MMAFSDFSPIVALAGNGRVSLGSGKAKKKGGGKMKSSSRSKAPLLPLAPVTHNVHIRFTTNQQQQLESYLEISREELHAHRREKRERRAQQKQARQLKEEKHRKQRWQVKN